MTNFASIAVEIPEYSVVGRESDGGVIITDTPMPVGDWIPGSYPPQNAGSVAWVNAAVYAPFQWTSGYRRLAIWVGGDYVTAPIPVLPSGTVVLPRGWALLAIL